jgi:hypothetical protein
VPNFLLHLPPRLEGHTPLATLFGDRGESQPAKGEDHIETPPRMGLENQVPSEMWGQHINKDRVAPQEAEFRPASLKPDLFSLLYTLKLIFSPIFS